jgi:hypothetical protein
MGTARVALDAEVARVKGDDTPAADVPTVARDARLGPDANADVDSEARVPGAPGGRRGFPGRVIASECCQAPARG